MSIPPQILFALKAVSSVASAGAGVAAQAGAASAQSEANEIAKDNAIEARDANYDQLHLMAQQEQAAAEQQIQENDLEALRSTETAKVAAGESGVTGLSVDALLADMYGKSARFEDNVNQNLEARTNQIGFEMENVDRSYRSTVSSLPQPAKPDYLGATIKAGSGIFGAYKDHLKVK